MTHGKQLPPTLGELLAKFEETNAATIREAQAAIGITMDQYVRQLESTLAELYYMRRARVIEDDSAWCAGCGRVAVDCSKGIDVCAVCLPRIHAAAGLP